MCVCVCAIRSLRTQRRATTNQLVHLHSSDQILMILYRVRCEICKPQRVRRIRRNLEIECSFLLERRFQSEPIGFVRRRRARTHPITRESRRIATLSSIRNAHTYRSISNTIQIRDLEIKPLRVCFVIGELCENLFVTTCVCF